MIFHTHYLRIFKVFIKKASLSENDYIVGSFQP